MRRILFLVLLPVAVAVVVTMPGWTGVPESSEAAQPAVVPVSLEGFYPPKAPGPLYLMEMHKLSAPFSGMMSDLFEGDQANALANFEAFKAQYLKVAAMVPEWEQAYPIGPVDELGRAIKTGEQAGVMQAAEAIGKACHNCHASAMVPVQQRFHWGDFGVIAVTDPMTGHDASFVQLMHLIESDLSGIGNDLQQGQIENARGHAQGLAARYATLKETCTACHESERAYFVDDRVMQTIADLKPALEADPVQPETVGRLLQIIGQESCFKCHLVHLPAAYSAHR